MGPEFIIFFLAASFAVSSSRIEITDKHDLVVVKENSPTTLGCTGNKPTGDISINWMVKPGNVGEWKLILSANEKKKFSGGASKKSIRLADSDFQHTGDFSLFLSPKEEDGGLYMCLIKQQESKLKEKIFLLAVFTVSFYPAAPVPQNSILRLIGRFTPVIAVSDITWTTPGGLSMKIEQKPNSGAVTKLPRVQKNDSGTYTCTVNPLGNGTSVLAANVNLIVDADKEASFTSSEQYRMIQTGTQAHQSFALTCPSVQGDCVQLHWLPPNDSRGNMKNRKMNIVYEYDRWRGSTQRTKARIELARAPDANGSFSFLLTPELNDGGVYVCKVFLNDNIFTQTTTLSVLKVKANYYSSELELLCRYSELPQVYSVVWEHQNKSRRLVMNSRGPGSISTTLPLPITSDVVGKYTCVLQLKTGHITRVARVITLPPEVSVNATTPFPFSTTLLCLFALLLPVPLVAAAVGVLLWRQKHISDRGIEQSLSVHSGEAENLYENPEDIRQQALPQASVYMDLKPRRDSDVYEELERYEQCQG